MIELERCSTEKDRDMSEIKDAIGIVVEGIGWGLFLVGGAIILIGMNVIDFACNNDR